MNSPDKDFYKYLLKYCKDVPKLLIECGAHNGIHRSVGYMFEKKLNWKCLNIEPNPFNFKDLIRNRPNSININCGLHEKEGSLDFYLLKDNLKSGNSTFSENRKSVLNNKFSIDTLKMEVECKRLDTIINDQGIDSIGLFILDVEGLERQVLSGMTNMQHSQLPRVIAIEDDKISENIFKNNEVLRNYSSVGKYKNNSILKIK